MGFRSVQLWPDNLRLLGHRVVGRVHFDTGPHLLDALGDNGLAWDEALEDDHASIQSLSHLDRASLNAALGIDDQHKRTRLIFLHGRLGNNDAVLGLRVREDHAHIEARH